MTPTIEGSCQIKVQVTVTQQDDGRDTSVERQEAELSLPEEPRASNHWQSTAGQVFNPSCSRYQPDLHPVQPLALQPSSVPP